MKTRNRRKFFPFFPLIIVAAALLLGFVVMQLWNAVVSPLLHVDQIGYWQAIGLFILCRILTGGFRGRPGGNGPGWKGGQQWRRKWMNMTDEEKSAFRDEWKKRCGSREENKE